MVWFGTDNGTARINKKRKKTEVFRITDRQGGYIRNVMVNDILVTAEGEYWLATNDGILKYSREGRLLRRYDYPAGEISHSIVKKIMMDSRGVIWIGTNDGLNYYDRRYDRFVKVTYSHEGFVLKYIYDLAEDGDGDILVNISSGICFITPETDKYGNIVRMEFRTVMMNEMISSDNSDVCCFHTCGDGNIWIGTINAGMLRYEKVSGHFTHYHVDAKSAGGIVSNRIYSVHSEYRGDVWVGTDLGLCRFEPKSGMFTEYRSDIDLSRSVRMIVPAPDGKMVIAGVNKLTVLDPVSGDKVVCDLLQDLSVDELSYNCYAFDRGHIVLGGDGGLVVIDPRGVQVDETKSPVVISAFTLQGREIFAGQSVGGRVLVDKPLELQESIKLKHSQNSFRFNFALLNFASPETNKYQYILEGYDPEWIPAGEGKNYAAYTNLPPGHYNFRVAASNPDGIRSDGIVSMAVVVMPPWWRSWWAVILYFLVFSLIIGSIGNMLVIRIRLTSELRLEKMERSKMEELNQIKMRFFTNISHEFKTPLSLMLGPLEELEEGERDKKRLARFELIRKNGERLLRLIDQIMDLRKYDNGVMLMDLRRGEYVAFARQVFDYFHQNATRRNIVYIFEDGCGEVHMFFDHDKIEKVIFNLLSNAFKFTPNGGHIEVTVKSREYEGRKYVETTVSDNGHGIQPEEAVMIFDRFYQGKAKPFEPIAGTGIGLGLTWDYLEQHGGVIDVESASGRGSIFRFRIPCDLKGGEIAGKEQIRGNPEQPCEKERPEGRSKNMKVLVVDDNDDILRFIRMALEDIHEITTASSGEQACEMMRETFPDIIIADVMMPGMDGFELCRRVKGDIITCHISVILLTAKNSERDRAEGYSCGADGYISKPFSIKTLKTRIMALAVQREKLQQKYRYMQMSEPSQIRIESDNDRFISDILSIIEKNIDNPDFAVQDLCNASKYSYQQIYRKIRALTGESVNEFIRTVRLKRAAQYLRQGEMRISEVMFRVGFNSHSYFTKCFREQFGVSPRRYAENEWKDERQAENRSGPDFPTAD